MIESKVPELADGGYWYVREAVPALDDAPGWIFGDEIAGAAWYAEIDGVMWCAIRTVEPIEGLPVADPITVSDIVGDTKPRARNGGL